MGRKKLPKRAFSGPLKLSPLMVGARSARFDVTCDIILYLPPTAAKTGCPGRQCPERAPGRAAARWRERSDGHSWASFLTPRFVAKMAKLGPKTTSKPRKVCI